MGAFCLAAGSYFTDLFTVEAGNGAYAFLPYLVTAAAVAILFAAAYFTFWRAQESRLLSRLRDAGAVGREAGKTLEEVGYPPKKLRTRFLMRLMRSPACMLYRNLSTEEIDALMHAFSEEEPQTETETKADASPTVQDGAEPKNTASDGSPAPETETEKSARKDRREHARELRRRGLTLAVREDTRFYIREDRLEYVEEQAVKFSLDDYMGLLYTTVITAVLWFIVMNFLDNIVGLFVK
ncbi:MAG: hypothetical protein ACI4SP_03245 [Eubacteriales bacterium]